MTDFMNDPKRQIPAGVLGISRGGRVIFLHGYGELRPGVPLPETAMFRQASVVKPITAAAIHRFAAAGGLGAKQLQRRALNLSGNGGVLNVTLPDSPPLGDARYAEITVGHLLNHSAGWDRNPQPITNPWYRDFPLTQVRAAGIQMNPPGALPTRTQLMVWALQFPLYYAPGADSYTQAVPINSPPGTMPLTVTPGAGVDFTYSNFGYLILGEILEALASGGYLGWLRDQVMTASDWVPATDWGPARSLQADLDLREPGYVGDAQGDSVFDYSAPIEQLPLQYGGWHLETMLAHGGLIASSQAMLRFGNLYSVQYFTRGTGAAQSNEIGLPIPANGLPAGWDAAHSGSLPGTSTVLRQLSSDTGAADDIVIHIAFNKRSDSEEWAYQASTNVVSHLPASTDAWPTETCDGFWVTLGGENPSAGFGGYHSNFQGFQSAHDRVGDGSDLRLRPGSQKWAGTITKRLRLDAPEGNAMLGQ